MQTILSGKIIQERKQKNIIATALIRLLYIPRETAIHSISCTTQTKIDMEQHQVFIQKGPQYGPLNENDTINYERVNET